MPVIRGAQKRLFSLKWQAVIAVSLVLALSALATQWVIEQRITRQFAALQTEHMEAQFRRWEASLLSNEETLLQLASFIPALEAHHSSQQPLQTRRIATILHEHATMLNLEWDIQVLAYYDANGRLQASWSESAVPGEAAKWIEEAAESLQPVSGLDCHHGCFQYLAVPVMSPSDPDQGILLLGRSIAGAIIGFARTTGSDIAVIDSFRSGQTPVEEQRILRPWGKQVPALSHPPTTLPLLKSLAEKFSLQELEANIVTFRQGQHWYQAAFERVPEHDFAYLLLTDVTPHIGEINKTRTLLIALSGSGFVLTAVLLLWYLGRPLSRLQQLMGALPAIGEHRHDEARRQLLKAAKGSRTRDEIDLLAESVGRLNDELETAEEARARAEEHLAWLADHDPLTGLFNRRRFQTEFERTLRQALRHGRGGAILYFDLDDFKAINDLCGHPAGDKLLREIAVTVQHAIRSTDLIARLGGDEFAVLVPECKESEAIILAEKLLDAVGNLEFSFDGQSHPVSCSIGITLFPQHGEEIELLLANADISMYQAKQTGHGQWHLFARDQEYREVLSARSQWRKRIAEALHNDLFVLHYQPIVDSGTNQIAWYEALVRMRDDDKLVFPDRFIPVAERTGQIRQIDRWVIEQAVCQLQAHPGLSLSVNLSGKVIDDPELSGWITAALERHDVAPERLIFEITETQAVENTSAAVDLIRRLTHFGCRFALDDFGSGFASYQYLKELPVQLVKIDGAFIRNMVRDEADRLFVKALAEVAQGLGKQTVAEFVEDAETLDMLRMLGVDFAQGYHVGRPREAIGEIAASARASRDGL